MEWRLKLINIIKKRSVILGIVIALVTTALGTVGILVINSHLSYANPMNLISVGSDNTNQAEPLSAAIKEQPTRGRILDRNGKELAVSIPAYTISINPRELKASGQDIASFIKTLANFLALEEEEVLQKVTASSAYEIIKRKVEKETGDKIREWARNNDIKGIMIDEDSIRYYPGNSLASHVIGFTGVDDEGILGVEQSMNQYLKLKGTDISVEGIKILESGKSVVLTIDAGIQGLVEKALDKAVEDYKTKNGAAAIVMNPKSGEILAMASRPNADIVIDSKNGEIISMVSRPVFDPNMPYSSSSGADAAALKGDTQENIKRIAGTIWKNKSLTDTFEPGSTFKAITSAIALEEGVVTPETPVDDSPVTVSGYKINCWKATDLHGKQTFKEAIYNSCNPVFVRVAQSLGIDKFYLYMKNFGFYDKTGLELPGEAKSVIHESPGEIDMSVAAFGQRFQITPIQLASAYGVMANGGKLMKPQIVKQIVNTKDNTVETIKPQVIRNVISTKTSESMKAILEGVVSKGTAANAYIEGYKIAGYAGTGEKVNGQYIASFAGFAPADNPEIVIVLMLDEPMISPHTGGMTAAPVAGKLMKDILDNIQ